jgi:hypothetical protein
MAQLPQLHRKYVKKAAKIGVKKQAAEGSPKRKM